MPLSASKARAGFLPSGVDGRLLTEGPGRQTVRSSSAKSRCSAANQAPKACGSAPRVHRPLKAARSKEGRGCKLAGGRITSASTGVAPRSSKISAPSQLRGGADRPRRHRLVDAANNAEGPGLLTSTRAPHPVTTTVFGLTARPPKGLRAVWGRPAQTVFAPQVEVDQRARHFGGFRCPWQRRQRQPASSSSTRLRTSTTSASRRSSPSRGTGSEARSGARRGRQAPVRLCPSSSGPHRKLVFHKSPRSEGMQGRNKLLLDDA